MIFVLGQVTMGVYGNDNYRSLPRGFKRRSSHTFFNKESRIYLATTFSAFIVSLQVAVNSIRLLRFRCMKFGCIAGIEKGELTCK